MRPLFSPEPGSGIPALLRAGVLAGGGSETYSGSVVTFTARRARAVKSLTAAIEPVQSGSGDPSPENVRPISGWDAVNVVRTGKNLLDSGSVFPAIGFISQSDGSWYCEKASSVRGQTIWSNTSKAPGQVSLSYTFKYDSTVAGVRFRFVYSDGTQRDNYTPLTDTYTSATFSSDANKTLLAIVTTYGTGSVATWIKDAQVEFGAATAYAPYTGHTYPISLGRTVYGGGLDVTSGVLTVDRAMVDMGTLTWSKGFGGFYSTSIRDFVRTPTNLSTDPTAICSVYPWGGNRDEVFFIHNLASYAGYLIVRTAMYGSVADFKAAMDGVQLVYELATPQTYQLTPTEVDTLLGDNCIWADTGDIIVIV